MRIRLSAPASRSALFVLLLLAASHSVLGQAFTPIRLPDASPEAFAGQTVGVTDIKISYHRPAVNKRTVWGDLVPWNEVWRAGANQNTTISFSSDVMVGGQKLAAGTYGLHMIPTEKDWTVIFSNMADAWGSFSYDQKEDAARITVTPQPAEFQERLGYGFDDPTDTSVQAVMRWEKVKVAFPITVDTPQVALASIRRELRGLARFAWQGWNQAAAYCLRNNLTTEECLAWSDRSVAMNQNFANLRVKAGLLEKKGDTKAAEALRAKSLQLATENDMNTYGYQLMAQKKMDEAIDAFRKNVKDHPASWNVYDSLAEAYANKGDKKLAAENYSKALTMAPEDQKKRITGAIAKLKN
jgi:tetratricopeptide (TPR) repeat protein